MGNLPDPHWRKSSYSFSNGNCAEVAAWHKSSRSMSNGQCTEVAAWRKSTRSNSQGACAEAGDGPGAVVVRDSKDPDGPVLEFGPREWQAFTRSLQTVR
jgi:hypothetical protein